MHPKFTLSALGTIITAFVMAQQLRVRVPVTTDSIFKGSFVKVVSFADKTDEDVFKEIKGTTIVVISEFLQMPARGRYSGIAETKEGKQIYLYKVQLQKVKSDPPPFISNTIEEWKTDAFLSSLQIPQGETKKETGNSKSTDDFLNSLSIGNNTPPATVDNSKPVVAAKSSILQQAAATMPDLSVTDWTKQSHLYQNLTDSANREANLGHYDQALQYCNAAIRIHPNFAGGVFLRGRIYEHFGMYRQAIKDMEAVQQDAVLGYQAAQNIAAWRPYAAKQPLTNEEMTEVKNAQTNETVVTSFKPSQGQWVTVTCPKCGGSGKIEKYGRHTGYIKVVDYSSGKKLYDDFGVGEGFYTETCYRCSGLGTISKRVSQ